jgi:hypothetical protein
VIEIGRARLGDRTTLGLEVADSEHVREIPRSGEARVIGDHGW